MQELDSDEEYEPVSSGFNIRKSMKRSDRRKNTKPWTLDEVAALINGMSQFGTGQWTSVKRAFFSSSSRTATDISVVFVLAVSICIFSTCSLYVLY